MKSYSYETTADLPPAVLYKAITAIGRWPEWDPELEWTRLPGAVEPGAGFTLKPKGGSEVAMTIVRAQAPALFVDDASLPLAKMRTQHQFQATSSGARIVVTITISGWLSFLWDRVVARKQAEAAAEQTSRFVAFAAQFA